MKSKKSKLSAIVFFSVMLALALVLPNAAFALQSGDFTYWVNVDNTVTITGYTGASGVVVIPSIIGGMAVVCIGDYAFSGCLHLTSVTIPNSVTSIEEGTFSGCSLLTSVSIGNSVKSIGDEAFYKCIGLTGIVIPDSVTSIAHRAFAGCTGLTSIIVDANNNTYSSQDGVLYNKGKTVLLDYPMGKSGGFTIPSSVTNIEYTAFYFCKGLTSVTIPDSVTSIGYGAFAGCTGLTGIVIPDRVTSIEYGTFSGCVGLTSVAIGHSVISIGMGAFLNCSSLTGIVIPDRITSIGHDAFAGCTGLTGIVIPDSVTSIGYGAFMGCKRLTRAYFLGNAPLMWMWYGDKLNNHVRAGVFDKCALNFTICYTAESTGFTFPLWYGYPARVCPCAAEAIYGENSEQTELLREYRDKVLSKTPEGQEFIRAYYKLSPTVTRLLEQRPLLKNKAKSFIDSMLPGVRKEITESSKGEP